MMIKIKRINGGVLPSKQTPGSSGYDLCANANGEIWPKEGLEIPTGIAVEIPIGCELQVRPRSGLAFKHGVMSLLGTIDSDYRGEISIYLFNFGRDIFSFKAGDRLAQLVPMRVIYDASFREGELNGTIRGAGGFGSTGL